MQPLCKLWARIPLSAPLCSITPSDPVPPPPILFHISVQTVRLAKVAQSGSIKYDSQLERWPNDNLVLSAFSLISPDCSCGAEFTSISINHFHLACYDNKAATHVTSEDANGVAERWQPGRECQHLRTCAICTMYNQLGHVSCCNLQDRIRWMGLFQCSPTSLPRPLLINFLFLMI